MAMNINPAYFWLFCGLATAGGVGYILYDQNRQQEVAVLETKAEKPEPSALKSAEQPESSEITKPANPQTVEEEPTAPGSGTKQEEVTAEPKPPKAENKNVTAPAFDILRVEKDGSAVVAGSALPNSTVEIVDGETVIAKAKTGTTGDFAIVLDEPLKPGAHELFIRSTPENGDPVQSQESGIINVPDGGNDLIAMVTKPGAPSRIIQKPEPQEPKQIEEAPEEPVVSDNQKPGEPSDDIEPTKTAEEAGQAPADPNKDEGDQEIAAETEAPVKEQSPDTKVVGESDETKDDGQQMTIAKLDESKDPEREKNQLETGGESPDTPTAKPVIPVIPVLIEAAEVEGEKVFIAGTGEPGAVVNIYIDGQYKGSTVVGDEGAFLFEGSGGLNAGRYAVRADMLAADSVEVKARAEVSLLHKPEEIQPPNPVEPEKPKELAKVEEVETPTPPRSENSRQNPENGETPKTVTVAEPDKPTAQTPESKKAETEPDPVRPKKIVPEPPAKIAKVEDGKPDPKPAAEKPSAETEKEPEEKTTDGQVPKVKKQENIAGLTPPAETEDGSNTGLTKQQTAKKIDSDPESSGVNSDQKSAKDPTKPTGENKLAKTEAEPVIVKPTAKSPDKKAVVPDQKDENIEIAKVDEPEENKQQSPEVKIAPDNSGSGSQDKPIVVKPEPDREKVQSNQSKQPKGTRQEQIAVIEPEPESPKSPPADPKVEGLEVQPQGRLTPKETQNGAEVEIVKADRKPVAMAPLKVEGENKLAEVKQKKLAQSNSGIKEIVTGSSVIIRRGDNLWRVSRRKFGQGIRYTVIFEANKDQIRDPHWIYPGQVFKIPEVEKLN